MKKLIYLFISVLTIAMFCHSGYAERVVTDGLVSYWTFDRQDIVGKTARDVWGENDGTIVGSPKIVPGQVKDALEFDGSDDYVNLTNLGDFGSQIGASTFEAWVKTDFKKDWMTLFKVSGRCVGWGMDFNASISRAFLEDVIKLHIKHKGRAHDIKGEIVNVVNAKHCGTFNSIRFLSICDGEWHHIVYVYKPHVDAAGHELGVQVIYIDGEQHKPRLSVNLWKLTFIPFTAPVYLGAGNNRGIAEGFFNGIIDEVRIYNRPLTDAEILQNFESKTGLSVEPAQKLPTVWGALKTKL